MYPVLGLAIAAADLPGGRGCCRPPMHQGNEPVPLIAVRWPPLLGQLRREDFLLVLGHRPQFQPWRAHRLLPSRRKQLLTQSTYLEGH